MEKRRTITLQISPAEGASPFETFQSDWMTPGHQRLFEVVGRIVALWSRVEMPVDMMVGLLHHPQHMVLPKKFADRPRSLKKKLEFLSYAFSDFDEIKIDKEKHERLRQEIKNIERVRHTLVHWHIRAICTDPGIESISLHNPEAFPWRTEDVTYSISDLMDSAARIGTLGFHLIIFAVGIQNKVRKIAKGRS